jgi:glycopeptide antibiotics resistance protein
MASMRLLVVEDEPYMAEGEPSRRGGRVLLFLLFAVYLVLLAWIVMWKLEVPHIGGGELRQIKLVPFAPSACDGASELSEVVANVLLFLPFGLYLGLLAPTWPSWKRAGTVAGASLALEVAQYVLAVGSSDITDPITNTTGGLAGLGLLVLARRRLGARTVAAMTRVCSIVTVLALLATAILVVSPLSFAPPKDVLVSKHAGPAGGSGTVVGEPRRLDHEARGQQCRQHPF